MREHASPYYPPRAGWMRPAQQLFYEFRRWVHCYCNDRINIPEPATAWRSLWCLVLPGFSFIDAGWRRIGALLLCGWVLAISVYVPWLGLPPANFAFASMLGIHVTSVMHLINRTSPGMGVLKRLVISLAVLVILGAGVYRFGTERFVVPLEAHGKVYVMSRFTGRGKIQRGELLAFFNPGTFGSVQIRRGQVMGHVLALPGDTVEFAETYYAVNGVRAERLRWMPVSQHLVVPEKTWLVWPELDTVMRANIADELITSAVLEIALVPRSRVVGQPFKRWFWREQTT